MAPLLILLLQALFALFCFVLLFVGVTVDTGVGSVVGEQGVCLLLRRVIESACVFARCALVMRAGDDQAWFADVAESTLVLVRVCWLVRLGCT